METRLTLEDALSCWAEMLTDARDSLRGGWNRAVHINCYRPFLRDIAGAAYDAIDQPRKQCGNGIFGDVGFPSVERTAGPGSLQFECQGLKVMQGTFPVGTANSRTMAKRMRNALNAYTPGSRGY